MTDVGIEEVIASLSERGQMEWELALMRVHIKQLEANQCTCDCCCGTADEE
tara:strand:- start:25 stop:177 length:153 start_codon:yes stop_codon:yes gene_type:complete